MSGGTRELAKRRAAGGGATDYLVFRVGGATCGVAVPHVREIVRGSRLTPVPRAPRAVVGITSFRGRIVTVFDLAQRLAHDPASRPGARGGEPLRRRTLMLQVGAETLGFEVDEVLQVRRIADEDVEPAGAALGADIAPHVLGVARPTRDAGGDAIVLLSAQELGS